MNEVFLIGKIIGNIEFKFIINSKNISIVKFKIKTIDNQVINIKGYNEIADYIYSKLQKNNYIEIYGSIDTEETVTINIIEKLSDNFVEKWQWKLYFNIIFNEHLLN